MKKCYLLLLATLISSCRFEITSPSPNVTVNNSNSNSNVNNNDNANNVSPIVVVPPGTPVSPVPPTTTIPPTTGGPRAPDPVGGGILALPAGSQGTVLSIGQQNAVLIQQCSFAFIDALLGTLRQQDTRWGYVCKRGNCSDISLDVIAYHATAGPDVRGATGTYEIDVIGNSCSAAAGVQFLNQGFGATNVFSPTR